MFTNIWNSIEGKWSTFSNLFYFITGWYFFTQPDVMLSITGLSLMFLGIASGGYHWTKDHVWQTLDVAAIYASLWFLIYTIIGFIEPSIALGYLVLFPLISALIMGFGKSDFDSFKVVPILYLLLFTLLLVHYPGARAWTVTIVFLAGAACQLIGERMFPKYKDHFHALWHFFTNLGYFLSISGVSEV